MNFAFSEEQEQLRDWVHQFSVDVVRPAAAEWDEREEFPYPIVQQAAEIGLYSWEFLAQGMLGDKTGLTMPVAIEELHVVPAYRSVCIDALGDLRLRP